MLGSSWQSRTADALKSHASHTAGGGAVEAALSVYLEAFATTLGSREQLAIAEAADALLVIPKTLAVNAAKDATELARPNLIRKSKPKGLGPGEHVRDVMHVAMCPSRLPAGVACEVTSIIGSLNRAYASQCVLEGLYCDTA